MREEKGTFWKKLMGHFMPYHEDNHFLEDLSKDTRESLLYKLERDKAKQKFPLWLSWFGIFLYLFNTTFIFKFSNDDILIFAIWIFIFTYSKIDFIKHDMEIKFIKTLELMEKTSQNNKDITS